MRFRFVCACLLGCGGEVASIAADDAGPHLARDATTEGSPSMRDAAQESSCPPLGPAPDCPPGTRFLCHDEDPPTCGDTWLCSRTNGSFLSCTPYGDAEALCDCPKGTRVGPDDGCPAGSAAYCVVQTKWCTSGCCVTPDELPAEGTCFLMDAGAADS